MRRCLLVPYQGRAGIATVLPQSQGNSKNTVQHLHGTRIDSTFTRTQDGANETTTPLYAADPRYIVRPLPYHQDDLRKQVEGRRPLRRL